MSHDKCPEEMTEAELKAKSESVDLSLMIKQNIEQARDMLAKGHLHPYMVVYGYVSSVKQWGNVIFPIMMDVNPGTMDTIFKSVGQVCSEQNIYPFGVAFVCKGKQLTTSKSMIPKGDVAQHILGHADTQDILLITSVSIDNRNKAASAVFNEDGTLGEFDESEDGEVVNNPLGSVFVGYAIARAASKFSEMVKNSETGVPRKRSAIPTPSVN